MRYPIRSGMLAGATALTLIATAAHAQDPVSFLVVDYEAPGMGDWWQLLVKTHEEQSGVPIDVRSVPARQYYERLLLDAASGTAADILTVNPNNLGELIAANALLPLDDLIEETGLRERIREGGWDSLTVDGVT
jgi:ABC-type glycerol-3-phosphate transport system substrate-binding protein